MRVGSERRKESRSCARIESRRRDKDAVRRSLLGNRTPCASVDRAPFLSPVQANIESARLIIRLSRDRCFSTRAWT